MMTFKPTRLPLLAAALLLSACASLVPPLAETPPPAAPEPAPIVATPVPLPPPAPAASGPLLAESGPLAPLPPPTTGRIESTQDSERGDLWERVRGGFAMADIDNDLVRKWENWYARDPAYVTRMTTRGGRYLFHIVEEVQRRGLPTELALLPFIESAFNPQAQSHARAMGMWQFMPATGKDFELRQNLFRDDRRDVLASTRAALDYLERLNGMFSDWHLALAAYNWGQGNVSRAIERNRRSGKVADYLSLRMPLETREYVPKLQAVKNIVLRPEAFGLNLPPLENHPFFLSVPIERDIDVALAAELAGLELEEFEQLNPQMNKPVILAAGTPQVLLPYDNANRFVRGLQAHRGALATWTAWVAPRTLKPADAARLIGMSEDELRQANRIPKGMLVKAGSTLLVPRDEGDDDVAEHIAHNGLLALTPEGRPMRKIRFKAGRKGDSVAAVARRYRVSPAQVAQWNGVGSQARFKAGQTITVEVRAAPTRRAVASGGKKPAVAAAKGPRKPTRAAKAAPSGKSAKSSKTATKTAAKSVANRPGTAAAGPRKPPVASAKHPAR